MEQENSWSSLEERAAKAKVGELGDNPLAHDIVSLRNEMLADREARKRERDEDQLQREAAQNRAEATHGEVRGMAAQVAGIIDRHGETVAAIQSAMEAMLATQESHAAALRDVHSSVLQPLDISELKERLSRVENAKPGPSGPDTPQRAPVGLFVSDELEELDAERSAELVNGALGLFETGALAHGIDPPGTPKLGQQPARYDAHPLVGPEEFKRIDRHLRAVTGVGLPMEGSHEPAASAASVRILSLAIGGLAYRVAAAFAALEAAGVPVDRKIEPIDPDLIPDIADEDPGRAGLEGEVA